MGGSGGDYSDAYNVVRGSSTPRGYSAVSRDEIMDKNEPDPCVFPTHFPGVEIYPGQDIVIVVIDGTGSMGDDTFIIRDKIVLLEGQLRLKGYLNNPLIMICIVGDPYSDMWPLQVTKPERGDALIEEIKKTKPEGNGGGQGMEGYADIAYYLLKHITLDDPNLRPYLFFLGDEGIYPEISKRHVEKFIGDVLDENMKSETIFRQLGKKFNVFRLHRTYNNGTPAQDEKIFKQWKKMIGNERVQRLTDPKEVVDDMLGIIAIGTQKRTIDTYIDDMRDRGQSKERIEMVRNVLVGVSGALVPVADSQTNLPVAGTETKRRSSGSKKL